jgi:hypothetical protein
VIARRAASALAIVIGTAVPAIAQRDPTLPPATDEPAPVSAPAAEPGPGPAAEPAPEPAAEPAAEPAPEPAADDDALLAELGLDKDFDDKLHLYGFAEFGLVVPIIDFDEAAASQLPKEGTFYGSSLNVYLTRALSPRWRSLLETRFVYGPAGNILADGTYEHAIGVDPGGGWRDMQWGGVSIERAYLEYAYDDHLAVQVGTYLTPYGIWNVDHGAPAIVPGMRPWVIGQQLFPERQTGVHVYGKHAIGEYAVGYHATVSNGRGPLSAFHDLDRNKALGARLELHAPWLGSTDLGFSAFHGRSTDRPADQVTVGAGGGLVNVTPPGTSYMETSFAIDVRLQRGPLLVQGEAIVNDGDFDDGARALARVGFQPDIRQAGGYLLAAYRLDALDGLMPFVVGEYDVVPSTVDTGDGSSLILVAGGLNYRPIPDVVLKLAYGTLRTYGFPYNFDFDYVDARAAWVF